MKPKKKIVPRILISLLGVALILMGAYTIALGYVGKNTSAVITSIRREGGERTDGKPGRYTYNIGYVFELQSGEKIGGYAKKIGDSVYTKPDGTSTIQIRYFSFWPQINAPLRDTGLNVGSLILMLAGGALIFLINKPKRM